MYVVETMRHGVVARFSTHKQASDFIDWYEHKFGCEMFVTECN